MRRPASNSRCVYGLRQGLLGCLWAVPVKKDKYCVRAKLAISYCWKAGGARARMSSSYNPQAAGALVHRKMRPVATVEQRVHPRRSPRSSKGVRSARRYLGQLFHARSAIVWVGDANNHVEVQFPSPPRRMSLDLKTFRANDSAQAVESAFVDRCTPIEMRFTPDESLRQLGLFAIAVAGLLST